MVFRKDADHRRRGLQSGSKFPPQGGVLFGRSFTAGFLQGGCCASADG